MLSVAMAEGPMEVWSQPGQATIDGVEDLGPEGGREHLLVNPLKLAGIRSVGLEFPSVSMALRGEKSINPMLAFELMDAVDREARANGVPLGRSMPHGTPETAASGDPLIVERMVQENLPLDIVGGRDLVGREEEMIRDVDSRLRNLGQS